MPNAKRPVYLKALFVLCAVLFAGSALFCVLSAACKFFVLDTEQIASQIVTDEYLAQVKKSAEKRLWQESPYYGIPEEVLYRGLDEELLRSGSVVGAKNALDLIWGIGGETRAEYPVKPFADELRAYFETLIESGELVELNETALEQISEECAYLTESYLNPISKNLAKLVFENARVQKLTRLCTALGGAFWIALGATVLTLIFTLLLAPKDASERFFAVSSPFFCASNFFFAPVVLVLQSADLSTLVLEESVLKSLLLGAFSASRAPVCLVAYVWFALAAVLLIASIILKSREKRIVG